MSITSPAPLSALEIRPRIWTELLRACHDRHHEWRTPVLASVDETGLPQARTVVLRQANTAEQALIFYTDKRSPKIAELTRSKNACLVFWSTRLSWQLRVKAQIHCTLQGPAVDSAWAVVSQTRAANDYLTPSPPGEIMPAEMAQDGNVSASRSEHNLAIITAKVQSIDWLELKREGHRRANFTLDSMHWLTP
jgi:pyridoxamine 5'-phosphate oxidase